MIAFLRGVLASAGTDYIVLDVNGIGYKAYVPASMLYKLPAIGESLMVHTYLHVREDVMQLYGFNEEEDLELFEILLQVSGIGPKGALAILSAFPAASLKQAVISEQVNVLTQIPGIGKKTAQRMIIELKDKLAKMSMGSETVKAPELAQNRDVDEAVQALISLGYAAPEAKKAVNKVTSNDSGLSVENIIRKCLVELARI